MEFKEIKYENPLTLEIGKSPDSKLIEAANSYIFSNHTEMPGKLILLDGTVLTSKVGESFETLNGMAIVTDHSQFGYHVDRRPSGRYSFSFENCRNVDVWWEHK